MKKTRKTYLLARLLEESDRAVFNYNQLSTITGVPKKYVRVYASRLVQHGFAKRLLRGYISLTDDPFIISTQIVEPSYVSFMGALYIREKVQQAPFLVECVTPKNTMKIRSMAIEYHRIDGRFFLGYEAVRRYRSYVFVATAEKAVLDMVYFDKMPERIKLDLETDTLRALGRVYEASTGSRAKRVIRWLKENA
jgi:predicted transcriptional regulator of viral defense system